MNRVLVKGLRDIGVQVSECRAELWGGFLHDLSGNPVRLVKMLSRAPWLYLRLLWRYGRARPHDCLVVGYAGYLDVLLARLMNVRRRRPIVLVAFISLYDTIVLDRGLAKVGSWKARLVRAVDRLAFRAADLVLVDTEENKKHLSALSGVPEAKFRRSFVGEDDNLFSPRQRRATGGEYRVLFFGTYVPLHGIDVILQAAGHLLCEVRIRFTLIGNGQMYPELRHYAAARGLQNVSFVDTWVETAGLVDAIASADVCLGIFGSTPKAARVIPYKVFDAMAMKKPLITRDSPAIREVLRHGESALLSEPGNGLSVARAISALRDDPEMARRIAAGGHRCYLEHGRPAAIGRTLVDGLEERFETASRNSVSTEGHSG